jgi:arylsulfatase A
MKLSQSAVALAVLLSLCSFVSAREGRPNVILVYADDQGSVDVNCYGAKDLMTPSLDGLAERGVRFTQFYAAAPVCSPSRAALMTGRVPQRAGVPGNVSSTLGHDGMPAEQVTIAEMMKKAGYVTGHIGKWHLGYTPETMPNGQGYDYSFGHMGGCIDNWSHFFYWQGPNRHDLWQNGNHIWRDGEYFPELMVEEGHRFIEENKDRPFFMYWAINLPHYPLQGTEKWRAKYEHLPSPRNKYAAFISTMDEHIGLLLAKLDELDLRDDTIVIYQSDHGHSTEERTFGGGGSAGPYRGAKFSLFEGGIRVPAMISWPGKLPAGVVRGQMATNCDWMPTIAGLCGVEIPDRKLDGRSLVEVIKSDDAVSPQQTFHWQSGGGRNPQWAVRDGDWKLIANPNDTSRRAPLTKDDQRFLVNLSADVTEMTNLASEHPDVVKRLEKLHQEWLVELAESAKAQ